MAHYAFLNEYLVVTEVITGLDENNYDWETHYGNFRRQLCKRTSYNTQGGVHNLGGTPYRKNFAGIGFSYDPQRDAFIPPKPNDYCLLNEETCLWEEPSPTNCEGVYFARLDEDNIVQQLFYVKNSDTSIDGVINENIGLAFCRSVFGSDTNWKQTSHDPHFRFHFGDIGYSYDENYDAFIPPQPDPNWVLDYDTFTWYSPR
jgi:hypothetical protein